MYSISCAFMVLSPTMTNASTGVSALEKSSIAWPWPLKRAALFPSICPSEIMLTFKRISSGFCTVILLTVTPQGKKINSTINAATALRNKPTNKPNIKLPPIL